MKLKQFNKKAQSWYMDFIIAVTVLVMISIIFINLMIDFSQKEEILQSLIEDGKTIGNALISSGYYPKEPIKNNYAENYMHDIRIGITDNNYKINSEKLTALKDFVIKSKNNYEISKYLFGVKSNYYFYLVKDKDTILKFPDNSVYGLGNLDGATLSTEDLVNAQLKDKEVKNLARLTRLVFYNGKMIKMVILIWP